MTEWASGIGKIPILTHSNYASDKRSISKKTSTINIFVIIKVFGWCMPTI